jgi:hypothetical protein
MKPSRNPSAIAGGGQQVGIDEPGTQGGHAETGGTVFAAKRPAQTHEGVLARLICGDLPLRDESINTANVENVGLALLE